MTAAVHKHFFHAIACQLGEYGDQTVHYHPCCGDLDEIEAAIMAGTDRTYEAPPCDWVLFGAGPQCQGKHRHWAQSLADRVEAHADRQAYEEAISV